MVEDTSVDRERRAGHNLRRDGLSIRPGENKRQAPITERERADDCSVTIHISGELHVEIFNREAKGRARESDRVDLASSRILPGAVDSCPQRAVGTQDVYYKTLSALVGEGKNACPISRDSGMARYRKSKRS